MIGRAVGIVHVKEELISTGQLRSGRCRPVEIGKLSSLSSAGSIADKQIAENVPCDGEQTISVGYCDAVREHKRGR